LQGFYSPNFPVGSVIYPATVGKVTPEDRYSFPTGSVKVYPEDRYSFPVGSVIGRRRRTARTFPRNTAARRYLSHQRRHRTACCGRSRGSPFPTGSVFGACWCLPGQFLLVVACRLSPQGRYSRGALWPFPRGLGIPSSLDAYGPPADPSKPSRKVGDP
jgi:hypothetical protein